MIIGKGLIASLFINCAAENSQRVVFFASGVSNSSEERKEEFEKEKNLLLKTINEYPGKILIYFSTCSIYDLSKVESKYVLHKLKMEGIVKSMCKYYLILRVSNATGRGGNPNLLMNYLIRSVKNNEAIDVYAKATRNLISVEDIKNITLQLIESKILNTTINVAYTENYGILELIKMIEDFYSVETKVNLIQEGLSYHIDTKEVEDYFIKNGLIDKKKYLQNILAKYY